MGPGPVAVLPNTPRAAAAPAVVAEPGAVGPQCRPDCILNSGSPGEGGPLRWATAASSAALGAGKDGAAADMSDGRASRPCSEYCCGLVWLPVWGTYTGSVC
jgi:hypothetical protein